MKIAIAAANGAVSPHLAIVPNYLSLVERGQVKEMETSQPRSPAGGMAKFLAEQGPPSSSPAAWVRGPRSFSGQRHRNDHQGSGTGEECSPRSCR